MSHHAPRTYQEAIRKGGRSLTASEVGQIPTHHLKGATTLTASDNSPGSYCGETSCINGKKYLIYRDDTGGCTKYVEMDC